MRTAVLASLLMAWPMTHAGSVVVPAWFNCVLGVPGPNHGVVTDVTRKGSTFEIFSEWGAYYSFRGSGTVVKGRLVVRGCATYVDRVVEGCDESRPPVSETVKLPLRRPPVQELDKALERGERIPLRGPNDAQRLAARCEEIVERAEKKEQR